MIINAQVVRDIKALLPNGSITEIAEELKMPYQKTYNELYLLKDEYDDRVIYAALRKLNGLGYDISKFGVKLEDQK